MCRVWSWRCPALVKCKRKYVVVTGAGKKRGGHFSVELRAVRVCPASAYGLLMAKGSWEKRRERNLRLRACYSAAPPPPHALPKTKREKESPENSAYLPLDSAAIRFLGATCAPPLQFMALANISPARKVVVCACVYVCGAVFLFS